MIIEFPEYLPDLPDLNNPGTTVANNVVPSGDSYEEFNEFTETIATALAEYPRGAILIRDPGTGQSSNFAGTRTKLYKATSSTWDDVSQAGGYNLGTDSQWSFTQFGNLVIAVCIEEDMQSFNLSSSLLFSDLSADVTRPNARYVATVRDFVMVGNTEDSVDGNKPHRVRWSAINDATSWTVSATTQADFQDLDAQFGWITGIVGGDYAVIFQERAITRIDYIGSPAVFQFNTVEHNQGTILPKSIIRVGTLIYYIGIDGFYVFDGSRSVSIGANKVDKFFLQDFDSTYPNRVSAAVDYTRQLVFWSYPGPGNNGGTPNRMLIYNYSPNATKRWSTADAVADLLFNAYSLGFTLEQLDVPFDSNIDKPNMPSLDSRVWTGQNLLFGGFNGDHKFGTFQGDAADATIETSEYELSDGQRTDLFLFRPIIDGTPTTVTAQVGYRDLQSTAVTWSSVITLNSLNEAEVRINSRYFRFRILVSGGDFEAIGFQMLQMRKAGRR